MNAANWAASLEAARTASLGKKVPLFKTLLPYQRAGVEWILQGLTQAGGCILADEMGLGALRNMLTLFLGIFMRLRGFVASQERPFKQLVACNTLSKKIRQIWSLLLPPPALCRSGAVSSSNGAHRFQKSL